jgi:para-nitrobenzyl esterase
MGNRATNCDQDRFAMAGNTEDAATQPLVEVAQGRLIGSRIGRLYAFRGVPYAISDRFGPPRPVPSSTGIREAGRPGPICPQLRSRLEIIMGPSKQSRQMSEACQVLSIFSPDLNGKRPVMAWIHGGAYLTGGGEEGWYDTSRLADEGDIVTVTISYRLGAFGYLSTNELEPPNLGLQDQKAALRWIRENIAQFGGDPETITVFGQSAGAHSIASLLATNERPLFRRAIVQSGPFGTVIGKAEARAIGRQFRTALGKSPASATVEEMLAAQKMVLASSDRALVFAPVEVNPLRPVVGKGIKLDIMVTWTRDDAAPFVALRHKGKPFGGIIDDVMTIVATRSFISGPSKTLATTLRKAGHQVSTHEITWRPEGSPYGAAHCVELPLLFGHYADWEGAPMLGTAPAEHVERFGREARALWAAFAKSAGPPRATEWLNQHS